MYSIIISSVASICKNHKQILLGPITIYFLNTFKHTSLHTNTHTHLQSKSKQTETKASLNYKCMHYGHILENVNQNMKLCYKKQLYSSVKYGLFTRLRHKEMGTQYKFCHVSIQFSFQWPLNRTALL